MPSLRALEGKHKGAVFVLKPGDNTIGRDGSNEVCLHDEGVSFKHAILTVDDELTTIRDSGSTNGTFLNGMKVGEARLEAGDKLLLGESLLEFCETVARARAESPPNKTIELALDQREIERLFAKPDLDWEGEFGPEAAETLSVLAYVFATTEDNSVLLEKLARHLYSHLNADSAFVCLRGAPTGALEILHSIPSAKTETPHRISETTLNRVLEMGKALLVEDAVIEGIVDETESVANLRGQSVIYAPLLDKGIVGLTRKRDNPFTNADLRLVALCTRLAALVSSSIAARDNALSRSRAFERELKSRFKIVGDTPGMRRLFETIERVAPTDAIVLICGETGTGKELVARALHANSLRSAGPFVPINCAALPQSLLESSLFGHEKGAFTGADKDRAGCFEEADKGTLFLDEIAELTLEAQAKLLRVIEDGIIRKVGSEEDINVDVRLVLATHRDLEHEIQEGKFRDDLYYRVHVVALALPPLRDRKSDIPLLADFLLQRNLTKSQRVIRGFSDSAMQTLLDYAWPGNVRELGNAIARAVILGNEDLLQPDDFGLAIQRRSSEPPSDTLESLKEIEREHIVRILDAVGWKKIDAASILGINRKTLTAKCKEYGLARKDPI